MFQAPDLAVYIKKLVRSMKKVNSMCLLKCPTPLQLSPTSPTPEILGVKHQEMANPLKYIHAIAWCFGHDGLAQASLVKYMIKITGTKDSIPFEHLIAGSLRATMSLSKLHLNHQTILPKNGLVKTW